MKQHSLSYPTSKRSIRVFIRLFPACLISFEDVTKVASLAASRILVFIQPAYFFPGKAIIFIDPTVT
jgi:hypothetical protein